MNKYQLTLVTIVFGSFFLLCQKQDEVKMYIKWLKSDDVKKKEQSIQRLGEIGDRRAVKPLIQELKSNIPGDNYAVARALGQIGDKEAVIPLIDAVTFESGKKVNRFAAWALGELCDTVALSKLNEVDKWFIPKTDGEKIDKEYIGKAIKKLGNCLKK